MQGDGHMQPRCGDIAAAVFASLRDLFRRAGGRAHSRGDISAVQMQVKEG